MSHTGSNSTDPLVDRPLFGSPRSSDRLVNLVVGTLTGVIVLATLICAFAVNGWPPNGVNVFFSIVIMLICGSHLVLIYWYRQGDLEPRFRSMIWYNAFSIIMLCVVGNLYIYGMGQDKKNCGDKVTYW